MPVTGRAYNRAGGCFKPGFYGIAGWCWWCWGGGELGEYLVLFVALGCRYRAW